MNYDFSALSSFDFEELVRDLLQAKTGQQYETFKRGRDQGIDIRLLTLDNCSVIQCKHYTRSKYSNLKSSLKEEVKKLGKLSVDSYSVVTSLPLSRKNKKEILDIMSPFIKLERDILGQEDLNNLLGQFPEIEKQHYKLWLYSTSILQRVLLLE